MPMYTYQCESCDVTLVKMCPMKDRDNQSCEECGDFLVRKLDRPGMVYAPTARSGGYAL